MSWIVTYTGRHFDFANPRGADIHILDIAEGLSNECRYTGQVGFYSVAQHSVHCSEIVPPAFAMEALMHDAAEAYCKDISTPLKSLLPDYKKIERSVELAIRLKYGIPIEISREVKHADRVMLASERRDFMPHDNSDWELLRGIQPIERKLDRWTPVEARSRFWSRFWELVAITGREWRDCAE